MASRFNLMPASAEFPASAFPQLMKVNDRLVLAYDASTPETAYWSFVVPVGFTGAMTLIIHYFMVSATSGVIEFEVAVEALTDADAINLNTTASFATVNTNSSETVPGATGNPGEVSVTLTNNDSIAVGDLVRISISRDADDATNDTAAGDLYFTGAELKDAA